MSEEKNLTHLRTLSVDCSALSSFIVDLEPGARRGMLTEQAGCELVLAEILANQASHGGMAGVTDRDIELLEDARDKIALIDEHLPALRKLLEVVEETRALYDDRMQRQIYAIAGSVESRAKVYKGEPLLAKYEKTRAYRSAAAIEGARTRRRNLAETSDEEILADSAAE